MGLLAVLAQMAVHSHSLQQTDLAFLSLSSPTLFKPEQLLRLDRNRGTQVVLLEELKG